MSYEESKESSPHRVLSYSAQQGISVLRTVQGWEAHIYCYLSICWVKNKVSAKAYGRRHEVWYKPVTGEGMLLSSVLCSGCHMVESFTHAYYSLIVLPRQVSGSRVQPSLTGYVVTVLHCHT